MSLTPGPWKAARVFANNAPDSFKVFTKPFGGICIADCGDNEENANLCAAAPELLRALKDLQAAVHEYRLLDVKKRFRLCTADAQAGTAIYKAEGKA